MNDVVSIKQITHYKIKTKIKKVFQEQLPINWRMDKNNKPECDYIPGGWYISLENSYESLFIGNEKPDLTQDQEVCITISPTGA